MGEIDRDVISQLIEMDASCVFLHKIIAAYLEKSPDDLARINAAIETQDPEMLRVAAHSFKSSSYNLGAMNLAELCKALEQIGRDKTIENAGTLVSQIENAYLKASQTLLDIKEREGEHVCRE